jgi:hypothetical protein
MSPCLFLYGLAALVGAALGGPGGLLAALVLLAVVVGRHLLAHRRPAAGLSPGRAAAGGAR